MLNKEAATILRYEVECNERVFIASKYSRQLREKFASLEHGEHRKEASEVLRDAIEHAESMLTALRNSKGWIDGVEE